MMRRLREKLALFQSATGKAAVAQRRARYEDLRDRSRAAAPKGVAGYGYKVYSQSDEDGIIAEIFNRIGTTDKRFVEFGVGDGLENNTVALLLSGWSGLWIDGSPEFCRTIREGFPSLIASGQLAMVQSFITVENIDALIHDGLGSGEIDLLSVDIDGNDAHVLRAITCINPRVVVLEYNAKFGPTIDYCVAYKSDYVWRKSDRFGASLKHFELLMRERGYSLVGCSVVGTNSFFVRDDLLGDHFEGPFTAEAQFQPARYELTGLPAGHPPMHATIEMREIP